MPEADFEPPTMTADTEENKKVLITFLANLGRNFAIPTLEGEENALFTNHIKERKMHFLLTI
jgi:hypothetical protein